MQDFLLSVWQQTGTTILMVTHDVEEAIYLGQRVVLMAPRPGRVDTVYDVPLPAARNQEMKLAPEFLRLKREILQRIRETSGMKTDIEKLERLSANGDQSP
jgi:NitT/TauT family transport system ATP-binding protein